MIRPQYHFRVVGAHTHIWDVRKLAELATDCPVADHLLAHIAEVDEPYWYAATSGVPTCRSVVAHAAQIADADLSHPILLCPAGRILDGMHRVMKALGAGHTTIAARQLQVLPAPDHIDVEPDLLAYD